MSIEPIYVAQTAEPMTEDAASMWLRARMTEAKEQGCQHARYSVHETIPHLRLVEGWKETSGEVGHAGGDGEQRWALTSEPQP